MFGSYARGAADVQSDVDLVRFSARKSLLDLVCIECEIGTCWAAASIS